MSRRISLLLDDLHRRNEDALVERVARRRAEAARRDAADVVLVQAVGDPAEQLALPEHRAEQHHVHLVRGADPGVVGEEHVAVADAGVVAAVLQRPLHLRVGDAGHVLHVGPEIDELRVLGEDRRVEVERVHRHRRARQALDGGAVLLVHVPQRVPHDLEGDRVDAVLRLLVQASASGRSKASSAGHSRERAPSKATPASSESFFSGAFIAANCHDGYFLSVPGVNSSAPLSSSLRLRRLAVAALPWARRAWRRRPGRRLGAAPGSSPARPAVFFS